VRPPLDETWPPEVISLIEDCWNHDPDKRPTFRQIIELLQEAKDKSKFFHPPRVVEEKPPSGCCVIL